VGLAVGVSSCFPPFVMALKLALQAIIITARSSAAVVAAEYRGRLTMDRADQFIDDWAERLLRSAALTVQVRGTENLPPGESFVVMSNHQSHFDIPVLYRALPIRMRMVAKAELFKVPLWAAAMRRSGFIPIDRGDRLGALKSLRLAQDAIRQGTSIWIAPEGTRSPDGALLPFKKGGFHIARAVGARILPVTIDGTSATLPSGSMKIRVGQRAVVTIGAPIDPKSFPKKDLEPLMEAVRTAIEAPLGRG